MGEKKIMHCFIEKWKNVISEKMEKNLISWSVNIHTVLMQRREILANYHMLTKVFQWKRFYFLNNEK